MSDNPRDPIPVLVTGIGGGGHGEQIVKALRLGRLRYHITGTDTSEYCANRSRIDRFVVLPTADEPAYLRALIAVAKANDCVAVFHGSEAEMSVLSRARDDLAGKGFYVPVNPPRVLDTCQDKAKTLRHLSGHGFPVPEFHEITGPEDLARVRSLPAVLKPSVGGGGSADVFIAQSRAELEMFARYLLEIYPRFVVQEYVGTPDQEYTVGVLFGADGALINSIAIRRIINNALTIRAQVPNRTGRAELGEMLVISTGISQGHVADWPEVRRRCEKIAASLQPTAPINIQCRVVDGAVIPFEINPRFSGTTSLRAMAGYNEPEELIQRDVFGKKEKTFKPYREIVIYRRLEEEEVSIQERRD